MKTEKKKLAPLPDSERQTARLVRKLWRALGVQEGALPAREHYTALERVALALHSMPVNTARQRSEIEAELGFGALRERIPQPGPSGVGGYPGIPTCDPGLVTPAGAEKS